jgi:hypothetical protein
VLVNQALVSQFVIHEGGEPVDPLTPAEVEAVNPYAQIWLDRLRVRQKHTQVYQSKRPELGTFTVRPVFSNEVSEACQIYMLQFKKEFQNTLKRSLQTIKKQIKESPQSFKNHGTGLYVMTNEDKRIVGIWYGDCRRDPMIDMKEGDIEFFNLKVLAEYQNIGLASILYTHSILRAFIKNPDTTLHVLINDRTPNARYLAEKNGFQFVNQLMAIEPPDGCFAEDTFFPVTLNHLTLTKDQYQKTIEKM